MSDNASPQPGVGRSTNQERSHGMALTERRTDTQGVVEVLPAEIDALEMEIERFVRGERAPNEFMAFRLLQGVYGQRQPDVHMVRVKVPFGGLSADQLDVLGTVAERFASLRKGHVTTRADVQFHHLALSDVPTILRILGDAGLTTREAAGNTVRNVTACPLAGVCANEPFDVTPYAAAYSRHFLRHPLTQTMPRKIKTAFAGCERDCVVTSIHDLGFVPRIVDGKRGFKMVVGGGTSIMPRVAPTLYEFVLPEEYLKVSEAVVHVFHRADELRRNRMKARLKFLVDRIGIDEFRVKVENELRLPWARRSFDPSPLLFREDESLGAPALIASQGANGQGTDFERWLSTRVRPQRQEGYRAVIVKLPLGDVRAEQFHHLADIFRRYAGGRARTSAEQDLALRWVPEQALYEVWKDLNRAGLGDGGAHGIADVVSCPGTDSCKMGITASMGLGRAIQGTLDGLSADDPLVREMRIKMSACPNGCGRHHIADIGFQGAAAKGPGGQVPAYELLVGGSYGEAGVRFGQRVGVKIPAKRVPEALRKVLAFYQQHRNEGEPFREFVARIGADAFEPVVAEFRQVPELSRESLDLYIDWDRTVKYVLERGEGECSV